MNCTNILIFAVSAIRFYARLRIETTEFSKSGIPITNNNLCIDSAISLIILIEFHGMLHEFRSLKFFRKFRSQILKINIVDDRAREMENKAENV